MSLSPEDRVLCRLFVAIVVGDWHELRRLRAAAGSGEPNRAWREAVLQTHVFAGFPRLVEAHTILERAGGLGPADGDEQRQVLGAEHDKQHAEEEHRRGRELFESIYEPHHERVRGSLERRHRDFADWLEGHAYGRIMARPGLSADRREVLAVLAIAVLGQKRQLASHARGALRLGATRQVLAEALAECADLIGEENVERALGVIERLA